MTFKDPPNHGFPPSIETASLMLAPHWQRTAGALEKARKQPRAESAGGALGQVLLGDKNVLSYPCSPVGCGWPISVSFPESPAWFSHRCGWAIDSKLNVFFLHRHDLKWVDSLWGKSWDQQKKTLQISERPMVGEGRCIVHVNWYPDLEEMEVDAMVIDWKTLSRNASFSHLDSQIQYNTNKILNR